MGYQVNRKKSKGRNPGAHPYTDEDMKRVNFCLTKKDIAIMVSPNWKGSMAEWLVEIRINGSTHVDPNIYTAKAAYEKMYEYYKYYYDKYSK